MREGGRERGKEGEREREGGRERGREGEREGWREGEREGGRDGEREGGREGRKEEWMHSIYTCANYSTIKFRIIGSFFRTKIISIPVRVWMINN